MFPGSLRRCLCLGPPRSFSWYCLHHMSLLRPGAPSRAPLRLHPEFEAASAPRTWEGHRPHGPDVRVKAASPPILGALPGSIMSLWGTQSPLGARPFSIVPIHHPRSCRFWKVSAFLESSLPHISVFLASSRASSLLFPTFSTAATGRRSLRSCKQLRFPGMGYSVQVSSSLPRGGQPSACSPWPPPLQEGDKSLVPPQGRVSECREVK